MAKEIDERVMNAGQVLGTNTPHTGKPAARGWLRRRSENRAAWLLLPVLVYFVALYAVPMIGMFNRSFRSDAGALSLEHYVKLLNTPAVLKIFVSTFQLALTVTLVCLILGYPVAYLLSKLKSSTANLLMIMVLLPFWTSILVRSYSWMVLLGREGVVNSLLVRLGLISEPLKLMFNSFGVHVGMSHILLPFMILALYSVMQGIDRNLVKAAQSLGATPARAFVRVFLPLSLPGIGSGCLLVFIQALGFYITPALLGSAQNRTISMAIDLYVNTVINWGLGSAIALVLFILVFVLFLAYNRLLGLDRLFGG
jgi:ABC-type spermidine/putrescine transport system permease subunit I